MLRQKHHPSTGTPGQVHTGHTQMLRTHHYPLTEPRDPGVQTGAWELSGRPWTQHSGSTAPRRVDSQGAAQNHTPGTGLHTHSGSQSGQLGGAGLPPGFVAPWLCVLRPGTPPLVSASCSVCLCVCVCVCVCVHVKCEEGSTQTECVMAGAGISVQNPEAL
jgi:hypothetical protein